MYIVRKTIEKKHHYFCGYQNNEPVWDEDKAQAKEMPKSYANKYAYHFKGIVI